MTAPKIAEPARVNTTLAPHLSATLRKWDHVGPRLCEKAADLIEAQATLLREFCACFESGDRPLGKSLQGWDNPRLHRARDNAMALLSTPATQPPERKSPAKSPAPETADGASL